MWIVLLDHSESMGEPFRGSMSFAGRSVTGGGGTKLEEARHALFERVRGLAPNERVVVIAFTSSAEVVFDDLASEASNLELALAELEPTNGTSVAAAFDAAVELLAPAGKTNARVLLVSDCQSELPPAIASADRLIQFVHVIDVLLIDPDETTEAAARAMIRLGEVQAVVSPEQLHTAVRERDAASQQVSNAVGRAMDAAATSAEAALEQRARDEGEAVRSEVSFSAGYAPVLRPGSSEPLWVIIHPTALKKEVGERLERMLAAKTSEPRIAADGRTRLPKGAEVRIEPAISGVDVNPARMDVLWQDRVEDFRFTMTARPNTPSKYVVGAVNVWYGPAQIACLPVAVQISTTETTKSPKIEETGLFGSVFPSYSRKDKSVVDVARGYYEALGIAVLQDTHALSALSGVDWQRALDALILKADAFQLYWSHASATSPQVEREWRFALAQGAIKNDRWIRPLRWREDIPDLPTELAHLQMGWLPGVEEIAASPSAAAESIRCVVMPLVDCSPEQRRIVERECREAVHHVETVTGLRCYPPPVLLVDEYFIQQQSPPSVHRVDESLIYRFAAAADLLQAMSLDIHTCFGRGKLNGDRLERRLPLNLSLNAEAHDLALNLAEWIFAAVLEVVLAMNGFIQPRKYGSSDGPPVRVAPDGVKPSARMAEFLSSRQNVKELGVTVILSLDRGRVSDAAIEWLEEITAGVDVEIKDRGQSIGMDVKLEPLRVLVQRALIPEVAAAIDKVNPLTNEPPPEQTPGIQIFSWLAEAYFRYIPEAADCGALAESIGVPTLGPRLEEFVRAAGYATNDSIQRLERLLQSLKIAFDEAEFTYGPDSEFITGYSITPESLAVIGADGVFPHPDSDWTYLAGTFPAMKQLFARASDEFLAALRVFQRGRGTGGSSPVEAHTYGVFIPSGPEIDRSLGAWAAMNGVADALTFPGSDRILLCMETIRRSLENIDDVDARRMVRRLVLIHEFLHATIWSAVGPDESRRAALRKARNAEESLAVWLELDSSRNYPAMRKVVEKYISYGTYPDWPYAGAMVLESRFNSREQNAIQSFVRELIDNPVTAQGTFDTLVQG